MSDSAPSLQVLLDQLQAGGAGAREARNELIGHSQERFRLLVRRMLRGFPALHRLENTSDVLQDVLVRIDSLLQSIDVTTPRDFLRLAAVQIRRVLIDLTRHHFGPEGEATHQIPPGQNGQGVMPDPADKSEDPYQLARWSELHEYIAGREEGERELFELIYYQGLNQAEASAMLDLPVRTLQRSWQRARMDLKMYLGEDFIL